MTMTENIFIRCFFRGGAKAFRLSLAVALTVVFTASQSSLHAGKNKARAIRDITAEVVTENRDGTLYFNIPVEGCRAGTYVELDATVSSSPKSSRYYIVEYNEAGEWKCNERDLHRAGEPAVEYTFRCAGLTGREAQVTTVLQTIRMNAPDTVLQVRFRPVGDLLCDGTSLRLSLAGEDSLPAPLAFAKGSFVKRSVSLLGTVFPKDSTKVLCIGNSFTYFSGAAFMLKQIAWSQGHYLDLYAHLKGGQRFSQHLKLVLTDEVISYGDYDYAFLQDQSQHAARYGQDPAGTAFVKENFELLCDKVRKFSPDCRIVLEQTWAFPAGECGGFGTLEAFDDYAVKGAESLAGDVGAAVSPIGRAFAKVREERPDIPLYVKDRKHQSKEGSYLKACVNYLVLFGGTFNRHAPDCGLDPEVASYLRSAAVKTVEVKVSDSR